MRLYICDACRAESPEIYVKKEDGSVDARPEATGWKQSIDRVGRVTIVVHACSPNCVIRCRDIRKLRIAVAEEAKRKELVIFPDAEPTEGWVPDHHLEAIATPESELPRMPKEHLRAAANNNNPKKWR